MHKMVVGLGALLAVACWGPAMAESETEQIQETEQPGSEFELDVDEDGKAEFGRKGSLDAEEDASEDAEGNPLELGEGDPPLEPLDDPDDSIDPDPIDEELPGEGPESLSGPDDDDPLPE